MNVTHLTTLQQVVGVFLAGGGAVGILTLVKAYLAVRNSVDTREATGISNLERWRIDADKRADRAFLELSYQRELVGYWMRWASTLERLCITGGLILPARPSEPQVPVGLLEGMEEEDGYTD